MKSFILNLILTVSPLLLFSQTASLDNLYEKYHDNILSLDINLPNWIKDHINLDQSDEHVERALKKASRIKLLIVDQSAAWEKDIRALSRDLSSSDYESLIEFRKKDELINMYLSEGRDDQDMKELLVLVNGRDSDKGVLFSLKGSFTKKDIEYILDDVDFH